MATPQFDIKVGSDSSLYVVREVTKSDVDGNTIKNESVGLIKSNKPVLIRRTGDSLKGTTETIESNELRKGRTKSAPRKGNSSSEGSIDYEFSAETYDDILESVFRNTWTKWVSDSESKINKILENPDSYEDNTFGMMNTKDEVITKVKKPLVMTKAQAQTVLDNYKTSTGKELSEEAKYNYEKYPLIVSDKNYLVDEMTCGDKDIKYFILKQYGGIEGKDLYQGFEHLAANTMSLSVSPGQIVTGSFGFMGSNNPDLLQEGLPENTVVFTKADNFTTDKLFYVKKDKIYEEAFPQPTASNFADKEYYYVDETLLTKNNAKGIIKYLAGENGQSSKFFDNTTYSQPVKVKEWIDKLPKKSTSTDQFTAREGFMYINGERVRYGSSLSFELNNGLDKTFAIFEKDAIAVTPLSLDITGSFNVYMIHGYTEKIDNLATKDKDVEILFSFQDKEVDPDNLYVVQIFKTKLSNDISSSDKMEDSLSYTSFEEQACRIFRLKHNECKPSLNSTNDAVILNFTGKPNSVPEVSITVTKSDGTSTDEALTVTGDYDETANEYKYALATSTLVSTDKVVITVTYGAETIVSDEIVIE